jgi:hypothetical protein
VQRPFGRCHVPRFLQHLYTCTHTGTHCDAHKVAVRITNVESDRRAHRDTHRDANKCTYSVSIAESDSLVLQRRHCRPSRLFWRS